MQVCCLCTHRNMSQVLVCGIFVFLLGVVRFQWFVVVPVSFVLDSNLYSPIPQFPNSPFLVPRAHPTFEQTTCILEKNVAVVDVVAEENQDVLPNVQKVPREEKVILKKNLVLKKKA